MKTMPIRGDSVSKMARALGRSMLFGSMSPSILNQVAAKAQLVSMVRGERIVTQGDSPDAFYVILRGEAAVDVDGNHVCTLESPESIGEMGLVTDTARTATVTAAAEMLLLRLDREAFRKLFARSPEFGLGIARALAERLKQTSRRVPVTQHDSDDLPRAEVVALLPFEFVQRHRVLPLHSDGNQLVVGFVDDVDPAILQRVKQFVPSMQIQPAAIGSTYYNEALKTFGSVFQPTAAIAETRPISAEETNAPTPIDLEPLLRRMIGEGASDLHLSAGWKPRWRIDGEMREIGDAPVLGPDQVFELFLPVMDERWRQEFIETNDTDFAHSIEGLARFRVNLFRDTRGVGAVLRQIPARILTFEQLGLPEAIASLCSFPKGLVLVTGPTGSGKSTTLAAMIDQINNTRPDHIITLEDPVEFVHESRKCLVNQREIGTNTESFHRALKAALREDPDIVLIGEPRDLETVSMALETANTGHLVFGTLHTATAISTIDRIVDLFPPDQQNQVRTGLSEGLRGVVSQTLCKRKGGGRVAALEILMVDHAVANMIREGKTSQIQNIMQTQRRKGNQLLNDELARLVNEDLVDYDHAYEKALDKEGFTRVARR